MPIGNPYGSTWGLAQLSNFAPEQAKPIVITMTSEIRPVITSRMVAVPAGSRSSISNVAPAIGSGGTAPNINDLQEHGTVLISATVDKNGRTTELKIVKSVNDEIDKLALKAATEAIRRNTGGKPAILLGKPIESQYTIPITF